MLSSIAEVEIVSETPAETVTEAAPYGIIPPCHVVASAKSPELIATN